MSKFALPKKEHINKYKIAHMVGVAEYMRERAKDYDLDPEEMYIVGLLHDIGYLEGREGHEERGERILRDMGFDFKYCFAVRHHGQDLNEFVLAYTENVRILTLLAEADSSVNAQGFRVGFKGRLKDIKERYGKNHPAYERVKNNIKRICQFCKTYEIPMPHSESKANMKGSE